jgi:hypothetical protein
MSNFAPDFQDCLPDWSCWFILLPPALFLPTSSPTSNCFFFSTLWQYDGQKVLCHCCFSLHSLIPSQFLTPVAAILVWTAITSSAVTFGLSTQQWKHMLSKPSHCSPVFIQTYLIGTLLCSKSLKNHRLFPLESTESIDVLGDPHFLNNYWTC